jgi:Domain of unknown function (DUF4262)
MGNVLEKRKQSDLIVVEHIRKFGCHVVNVFDPDGLQPHFSYSIGIQETLSVPEVIVVGLRPEMSQWMVNEYNRRVGTGEHFQRGVLYSGFLEGFEVYVEPTRRKLVAEYTFGCDRYYDNRPYEVVQIVWPSTAGVWPWRKRANDWFRNNQPMLGRVRPDRP